MIPRDLLQDATASLVNAGALPPNALWGVPKFDVVFDHFARHDALIEFRDWIKRRRENPDEEGTQPEEFNEAKRAAQWIAENWQ